MIVKLTKGSTSHSLQADSTKTELLADGLKKLSVFNDGALVADELIGANDERATYDSASIIENGVVTEEIK